MKIRIKIGTRAEVKADVTAELNESETARAVYDSLPLEGFANVWGDEFYFEVPLYVDPEAGSTCDVNVGDIAYWPAGRAIAVFFGRTPLSHDDRPVPASEVNVIGRIIGDATVLKSAKDETNIIIEKA